MQNFSKAERLSGKKNIEELYQHGKVVFVPPFKICWTEAGLTETKVQLAISVPKRHFKKAVDRNKIKRRTREAYRKNKELLYEKIENKKLILLFIYTSKAIESYDGIETKMKIIFKKLAGEIKNKEDK